MTRILDGIRDIHDDYDAYFLDLWGVVHNGIAPYPGVIDCLERLRADHKRVILLSNAPREWNKVAEFLAALDITPAHYNRIVTSGDATRQAMAARDEDHFQHMGKRYVYLGPKRDENLLEALGYERVPDTGNADFLLCTGYDDQGIEEAEDFTPHINDGLAKGLPLICVNPDYYAMRGEVANPCAGLLAKDYEERGGTAHWYGKPYGRVYDYCLTHAAIGIDPSRILMVGDTLRTDIAGANGAGLSSALCVGGIESKALGVGHGEKPAQSAVDALVAAEGISPTFILPGLHW